MSNPVLPSIKDEVNEGSAFDLELTHLDKTKTKTIPTTLDYRIDDLTNDREVLDWTNISTPGSTNTITITGTQNTLAGRNQGVELRQITTRTTDSSGEPGQDLFHYKLIRLFDSQDLLF